MYFRLNPECFLVEGDHCGAIYDLIDGHLYALTANESALIKHCESNGGVKENEPFLQELKRLCIGNFFNKPIYIEKIRLGAPIQEYQPSNPPHVAKVFLEINNKCKESCWYCGRNGIHRSLGCIGCNIWNEKGNNLSTERWKQLIDELRDLECQSIYITGGDLTFVWDEVLELIDYAGDSFRKLFVTLNEHNYTDLLTESLGSGVQPIIQVTNHERISKDYFNLFVIDGDKYSDIKGLNVDNVAMDIVSSNFYNLPSNSPLISKKKFAPVNIYRFLHNKKFHPCLGNSLAISWTGEVMPCIMLRSHTLGNIRNKCLYTCFEKKEEEIKRLWTMNLDSIQKCRACEFRYACTDCRALEEKLTGDLYGKKLCNYVPERGVWI